MYEYHHLLSPKTGDDLLCCCVGAKIFKSAAVPGSRHAARPDVHL